MQPVQIQLWERFCNAQRVETTARRRSRLRNLLRQYTTASAGLASGLAQLRHYVAVISTISSAMVVQWALVSNAALFLE